VCSTRALQEADRGLNVERIGKTPRAPLRSALRPRGGARVDVAAQAVRAPVVRVPGAAVEFADMKMKLDAAQLLLYRAAGQRDRGLPCGMRRRSPKAFCTRPGFFSTGNESCR